MAKYKKVRYSNETSTFNIEWQVPGTSTSSFPTINNKVGKILVDAAAIQGTRKCKNMSLSISCVRPCPFPILCTLVYVPQGTSPSQISINDANSGPSSLYEPNQNVIMQFVLNPVYSDGSGSNVQRFKTRLARNLDSGDCIALVCAPAFSNTEAVDVKLTGTLNYAISF